MPDRFAPETLELLRTTQELEIETVAPDGVTAHRTVIWVVVDEGGRALIRSYLGTAARWYREALARSSVTLHIGRHHIAATAQVATDDDRISAASRGYLAKYPDDPSTPAMVDSKVLSTTLELVPR
jgi:hypothetical protein